MRYMVTHETVIDGPVPFTHDADSGETITHATREEAQAEIDEFLREIAADIARGDRQPEDGYDPGDFAIAEVLDSPLPLYCGGCEHVWSVDVRLPMPVAEFAAILQGLPCPNCMAGDQIRLKEIRR